MGTITKQFSFTPGQLAFSSQVNGDLDTLFTWANGGVEHVNIGPLGIYASDIKPVDAASATFLSSTQGWTWASGASNKVTATINAPSGQTVDILDVSLNGVVKVSVDSAGGLHGITGAFAGAITAQGATLQDPTDATKQAIFAMSTIATATARTFTFPNVSGTFVTTGDTGSVTNAMLAGGIANGKLASAATASTASTIALRGASGQLNAAYVLADAAAGTAQFTFSNFTGTGNPSTTIYATNVATSGVTASVLALYGNGLGTPQLAALDASGNLGLLAALKTAGSSSYGAQAGIGGAPSWDLDVQSLANQGARLISATSSILHLWSSNAGAAIRNFSALTNYSVQGDFALRKSATLGGNPTGSGTSVLYMDATNNWTVPAAFTAGGLGTFVGLTAGTGTVQGSSNSSAVAFMLPVYTAAGAATQAGLHAVMGQVTAAGASTSITLTGAGIFANGVTAVFVLDVSASGLPFAPVTALSGSNITFTSTAGHSYNFFAIGT